jgi:hypothetical protein
MHRLQRSLAILQPLAPALEERLRQAGLEHLVLLAHLTRAWPTIVGAQLARVSHPQRLRGPVLFVTVTESIWMQQFAFFQSQLLHNIHRELGDVPIVKVYFTLTMTPPEPVAPAPEKVREFCPLTPAEEQQVYEGTARIADPELRDILRRAWRQGWQAQR